MSLPPEITQQQLDELHASSPFHHWLLTTTDLTTPALEKRLGVTLLSRHAVEAVEQGWCRTHELLLPDGRLVERAEVQLPVSASAWAHLNVPLGPWLIKNGYGVEKSRIWIGNSNGNHFKCYRLKVSQDSKTTELEIREHWPDVSLFR